MPTASSSSRRIERATYRDVAVRYLTGNTHPDHETICAFRRNNQEAIAAAFVQVLELARELKRLKLGIVSLDGTQIRANASKDKNVTDQRAQQLRVQLQQEVQALLAQAEQADQRDEDPQRLPEEIARRETLLQKMDEACARLEARAKARAEADQAEAQRLPARHTPRAGGAQDLVFEPPSATPAAEEQMEPTNPDAAVCRYTGGGSPAGGA